MFLVIVISALVVWGVVATIVEVRRDGHRAVPTDWARVAEGDASRRPKIER